MSTKMISGIKDEERRHFYNSVLWARSPGIEGGDDGDHERASEQREAVAKSLQRN